MSTPSPGTFWHWLGAALFQLRGLQCPQILASFRVTGVSGEVTVTSKAAGIH